MSSDIGFQASIQAIGYAGADWWRGLFRFLCSLSLLISVSSSSQSPTHWAIRSSDIHQSLTTGVHWSPTTYPRVSYLAPTLLFFFWTIWLISVAEMVLLRSWYSPWMYFKGMINKIFKYNIPYASEQVDELDKHMSFLFWIEIEFTIFLKNWKSENKKLEARLILSEECSQHSWLPTNEKLKRGYITGAAHILKTNTLPVREVNSKSLSQPQQSC